MTRQVSPARPHPVSALMASASVYITVSRSGEMCSPWSTVSSPVLTMAVTSRGRDHLDHPAQEPGGADATGQGGDHRRPLRRASSTARVAIVGQATVAPPAWHGPRPVVCKAPCVPPERSAPPTRAGCPSGSTPPRCSGGRPGSARSVPARSAAWPTRPDVEVSAFAVSWRRRHGLERLGARRGSRPGSGRCRPALCTAAWAPLPSPPVEWFVGRHDVVHGTNFVVPPTRRAARVVTVHDLTVVLYPELCDPPTAALPGPHPPRRGRRGMGPHAVAVRGRAGGRRVRGRSGPGAGRPPRDPRPRPDPAAGADRGGRHAARGMPPLRAGHRDHRAPQGLPVARVRVRRGGRRPSRRGPGGRGQ